MRYCFTFSLLMFLFACSQKETVSTAPTQPYAASVYTWLVLGDSYSIGQGVTEAERFPAQTVTMLLQKGLAFQQPTYIATTGWTTSNLQNGISTVNPNPHTIVSLLIGVNDQYTRRDTIGYRERFTQLLIKSIELARGKKQNVFVLSIPDYSVTPFAASTDTARIRLELDWLNAINRNITNAYGCPYLDITASTKEARYNRLLLASDGLHPSGTMYKQWAERLTPMIVQSLK